MTGHGSITAPAGDFASPPAARRPSAFLKGMIARIIARGGRLRDQARRRPARALDAPADSPETLCRDLLSRRGEASGLALARAILDAYRRLDGAGRLRFFESLADRFGPDPERLERAWAAQSAEPGPESLRELLRAAEPPRQELFRRLNQAPAGTTDLVGMRADLLAAARPELAAVDDDLVHLLTSWFNRGFLLLERISWSSPADLLERLIRYEAVHMIDGWDDLRRRLQPADRRCYAFFHPALADEPLIFVEVALTRGVPTAIAEILAGDRLPIAADEATTAVFYSISNCQAGLRGISFGNLLIKQVVEELKRDLSGLSTFVTLSPVPGFRRWLEAQGEEASWLGSLETGEGLRDPVAVKSIRPVVEQLAARYLLEARTSAGHPLDPVARFHLGNGARLEQINWPADLSENGLASGAGLMVNYLYDPERIEKYHEAFWNSGQVAASSGVTRLREPKAKARKQGRI